MPIANPYAAKAPSNPYAKIKKKTVPVVLVSKNNAVVDERTSCNQPNNLGTTTATVVKQQRRHPSQHQQQLPSMSKNDSVENKPLLVVTSKPIKTPTPSPFVKSTTAKKATLPSSCTKNKLSFKAQLKEQIQQLKQQKMQENKRQEKEKQEAAEKIRLEAERKRMEPILLAAAERKKQEEAEPVLLKQQQQHLFLMKQQQQEEVAQKEQLQLQQQREEQQIRRDQQQRLQQVVRQEQQIQPAAVKPPTTPSQPSMALAATNTPQPTMLQHQVTPSPFSSCVSNTEEPIKLSMAQPFAQHQVLPVHQFHFPPHFRPSHTFGGYPMMNYHHPYSPTMPYPFYSPTAYPQAAIRAMPHLTRIKKPPMSKALSKPPDILSKELMISPSPYLHTHVFLPLPIVIYKHPNSSFGISLKVEKTSILVEPPLTDREMVANLLHTMINTISLQHHQQTTQPRRKRRRRLAFCAMSVSDCTQQNAISLSSITKEEERRLQPGDIVLFIDGVSTSGLSFPEACHLFGLAKEEHEGGIVQCKVMVARRQKPVVATKPLAVAKNNKPHPFLASSPSSSLPVVPPPSDRNPANNIPFTYNESTNQVLSGDFSTNELVVLAHGMIQLLTDKTRLLGFQAPGALEAAVLSQQQPRTLSEVKQKWTQLTQAFERKAQVAAKKVHSWNNEGGYSCWTDSQRASLRALPRPVQGCRCKSMTHTHVHDPKCMLYDDLRQFSSELSRPQQQRHAPLQLETSLKDLSALETAVKDRFVKLKEEQIKDEDEARFVAEMERIQLTKFQKAIFAPSLTAMVLSSLATMNIPNEFEKMATAKKNGKKIPSSPVKESSLLLLPAPPPPYAVEDDSDDDVPLVALLGKRVALSLPGNKNKDEGGESQKKHKSSSEGEETNKLSEVLVGGFNVYFLGKLLLHMSQTWGHVYQEPSHKDYAWRWEVFHGSHSDQGGTTPGGKNPKPPGSTSLETLQFGLNEEFMSRLELAGFGNTETPQSSSSPKDEAEAKTNTLAVVEAALIVLHLVSPERSGILDELLSLVRSGIIRKTKSGGAVLRKHWYSQVDNPLLLDDMNARWSLDADPENKHCVHNKIRYNLASYWMRLDDHGGGGGAWALSEDMTEEVYLDQDFEEWRQSFEEKAEMKSSEEDGIGKFGI